VYVTGSSTTVLRDRDGAPTVATNAFGKGRAVYLSGFKFSPENTRLLHRSLFWAAQAEGDWSDWNSSNIRTDCAYFPKKKKLVVINNSGSAEKTTVTLASGKPLNVSLDAHGIQILDI
jgi:beta-D-galactosyl-(1->4)-L-rhamnose phosphorylase